MERFALGTIRERLRKVKWGEGLSRDGIRRKWHGLPDHIYNILPTDFVFRNEGEVLSYLDHLLQHGEVNDLEDTGQPSEQYQPSPAGLTKRPRQHGVGSGADPGYTGGGSVQTGVGREGTTYGDTEEES